MDAISKGFISVLRVHTGFVATRELPPTRGFENHQSCMLIDLSFCNLDLALQLAIAKMFRSHRDLNSDRRIQSPEC